MALARAFGVAEGRDMRLGGGVRTIQQYLRAGLVDEVHLAIVLIVLGAGERLYDGGLSGFEVAEYAPSPSVAHVRLVRSTP